MTIFAGVLSIGAVPIGQIVKAAVRNNLRSNVDNRGRIYEHDAGHIFLVKWDSDAFAESAWQAAGDGVVCCIAGDPLLTTKGLKLPRQEQVKHLAAQTHATLGAELARCRGSFAYVKYEADSGQLILATDAIGLRTVYYSIQGDLIFFATALRVLEAIPQIKKTISVVGLTELSVFSFPLANRTPYEEITVLREAEFLIVDGGAIRTQTYYDWASPILPQIKDEDSVKNIYNLFVEAISLRAGADKRVYSFLSGGMDSRSIAATLIEQGRHIEALNFSPVDTQDQRFAQLFADQASDQCRLHLMPSGIFPNFSFLALAAKTGLEQHESTHIDRPQCIWSGDGGSVGLGHVYMDEPMLDLAEQGDLENAIKYFLDFNRLGLPTRFLTAVAKHQLPRTIVENVRAEINRYPRADMGRRIYLFLLFNDQRRHLFKHFETIDQHGLELLTPFYDTAFLQAVAATPARRGVLHRLYADFFNYLPGFARRTPWQTYPGHVPCPVSAPSNLRYQWSDDVGNVSDADTGGALARLRMAWGMLQAFESCAQLKMFARAKIYLAAVAHAAGLKNMGYLASLLEIHQLHSAKASVKP